MKREPILTESDVDILSWFSKPIMRSAIKYLSKDAVVALLHDIASEWNKGNHAGAEALVGNNVYGRLGPDVLLLEALSGERDI